MGDPLDDALDEALASYGKAPERPGLERRVLARVTERTMRTRLLKRFALAVGAAVVACGLIWWQTPKPAIVLQPSAALTAQMVPGRDLSLVLAHAVKRRRTQKRPAEPKLAVFPTPLAMGSQERALLRLASGDPKDIPRELIHSDDPMQPIQLTAIEIKPIQ